MFLEHVNLTVSDLDRTLEFYTGLLGYRLRWSGTTSDGRRAAHLGDDRYYLALSEAKSKGGFAHDPVAVGINHFGLVVDDLAVMKRRLAELGVTPHSEADYEPGLRLYFRDPDGFEVELVEYAD
ncbi:MAG: VOC family protein [Phycisphaerae bacterium]